MPQADARSASWLLAAGLVDLALTRCILAAQAKRALTVFYGFRVDKALLDLGIDANQVSNDFRREMKTLGKASNLSPQEVALFIAARTPLSLRLGLNATTLRGWVRDKRVDPEEDTARKALHELGVFDLS